METIYIYIPVHGDMNISFRIIRKRARYTGCTHDLSVGVAVRQDEHSALTASELTPFVHTGCAGKHGTLL